MIQPHPSFMEFWNALCEVLKIEGAVLLIPGLEGVDAANSGSKDHLPGDMASALQVGRPGLRR